MADNLDPKNFAKAFADAVKLREESQRTLDIIKDQLKYLQIRELYVTKFFLLLKNYTKLLETLMI